MSVTTQTVYGLEVGGYRVSITNWKNGQNETFFATWVDAQNYLLKYEAYGYKGSIETIFFHVPAGA